MPEHMHETAEDLAIAERAWRRFETRHGIGPGKRRDIFSATRWQDTLDGHAMAAASQMAASFPALGAMRRAMQAGTVA